jgi:hypothetical protein
MQHLNHFRVLFAKRNAPRVDICSVENLLSCQHFIAQTFEDV